MSGTLVHRSPSRFHFEYPCCEPIAEAGGQRPRQRKHDWPAVFALLLGGRSCEESQVTGGRDRSGSASEERARRAFWWRGRA